MSFFTLFAAEMLRPIVIVTRTVTGVDDHGNEQRAEVESDPVMGYFEPTSSSEVLTMQQTQQIDGLVVIPVSTLTGIDALKIDDLRYSVIGPPRTVHDPFTGGADHTELDVALVAG